MRLLFCLNLCLLMISFETFINCSNCCNCCCCNNKNELSKTSSKYKNVIPTKDKINLPDEIFTTKENVYINKTIENVKMTIDEIEPSEEDYKNLLKVTGYTPGEGDHYRCKLFKEVLGTNKENYFFFFADNDIPL